MGSNKRKKKSTKNGQDSTTDSTTPSQTDSTTDPLTKSGEEVADDDEVTFNCSHAKRYKQPASDSKKGKHQAGIVKSVTCLPCVKEQETKPETAAAESQALWFCMMCYETRCGRYNEEHGLKHFELDKTHCLSLSVNSWRIWCYECDRFLDPSLVRGDPESTVCLAKKAFEKRGNKSGACHKDYEVIQKPIEVVTTSRIRVIGLHNLGNTCYFNSALQNLLYLGTFKRELDYTLTRTEFKLVPKKHPDLGTTTFQYSNKDAISPGDLTKALYQLIQESETIKEPLPSTGKRTLQKKRASCSPREVQQAVSKRHKKFSNFSQQDSHELLRFLIDMIKDEEIKRLKVAFLDHFCAKDHKKEFKKYPEEKQKLLKKYASEFKNIFVFTGTFIDDVFGGKMLSVVKCHTCGNIFTVDEDFLDLSLPLPGEKPSYLPTKPANQDSKKNQKQAKKAAEKERKKEQKQSKHIPKTKTSKACDHTKDTKSIDSVEDKATGDGEEKMELSNDMNGMSLQNQANPLEDMDKGEATTPEVIENESNSQLVPEVENIEKNEHNTELDTNTRETDNSPDNNEVANVDDSQTDSPMDVDPLLPSIVFTSHEVDTTADISDVPEQTTHTTHVPEQTADISDAPEQTAHSSDAPEQTTDTTDGIEQTADTSDVPEQTAHSSDVPEQTTDTTDGIEQTADTSDISEQTTDTSDAPESKEDTADVVKSKEDTADVVKSKEDTADVVRPKEILRLNTSGNPSTDTLEHFLARFFSAETLQGDYLCMQCNPQLALLEDGTESGESGEGTDEKENSQESIDLSQCHFSDATKQFHIQNLPPVLTIHLKRFSQIGARLQKINKHIKFPPVLDMSPYCVSDTRVARDSANRICYGLRGLVSHSGGMVAGHYIACVNIAVWSIHTSADSMEVEPAVSSTMDTTQRVHMQPAEEWYHISDSHVRAVNAKEVYDTQAYILFYERLPLVDK